MSIEAEKGEFASEREKTIEGEKSELENDTAKMTAGRKQYRASGMAKTEEEEQIRCPLAKEKEDE